MKLRLFSSLCFFAAAWATTLEAAPIEGPSVRVAVLQEVSALRLTVEGPCRLLDLKKGTVLAQWPDLGWKRVAPTASGLSIGDRSFPASVLLEPLNGALFRLDSRPYRGSLILRRTPKGRLTLINRLDLEDYLVGALNSEVSAGWPMEALKAHAVVSRTMVAHRIWIRKGQDFDVTSDASTHLYHGVAAERGRTREAVEATRGQVLVFDGELFSATFHANCGGHTEDVAELWEVKRKIPPLRGVPDPHCKNLKHYRWNLELDSDEFQRLLGPEAAETGAMEGIEIVERNESGRARSIRLRGDRGTVTLTGRRFRELLGANRLRSLNFTVLFQPGKVSFSGFGWGHGVGLCQWGAFGMARNGRSMDEVLSFYFPEARRCSLKGLPGFPRLSY